jgi:hypothetical protein
MSNDTSLDIRKIPVSELQFGRVEVLQVLDDVSWTEDSFYRCFVIGRKTEGQKSLCSFFTDVHGNTAGGKERIIRKKQLKGRVLYRNTSGGIDISCNCFTEAEFKEQCSKWVFIRILTEVPELPTEEI